jgi:peptidoglycan/LPS O-acetylase OafA/YrhL
MLSRMKSKIYFQNLNGLRFIAAVMVLFPHIEQLKERFGLPAYNIYPHPDLGKLGVILFFVLSGFLITYLLMRERQETKSISLRQFYVRRALRIYPLYYLIICLTLFLLPLFDFYFVPGWSEDLRTNFGLKIFLYLFFFPNLAEILFPPIPLAGQIWSVGVEEQFYFVWAILAKKVSNILVMLTGVIIFYLSILSLLLIIKTNILTSNAVINIMLAFWQLFRIDCMAFGGLAAYLLFYNKQQILSLLFNKYIQIFLYSTVLLMIGIGFEIPIFTYEVFAVFFAAIILNLAGNKDSILGMENKFLDYGGKISYGIYMFHFITIVTAIKLSFYVPFQGMFVYAASFLLTILTATLSYEFFEKKFIKAKIKYSPIISGDNVKTS